MAQEHGLKLKPVATKAPKVPAIRLPWPRKSEPDEKGQIVDLGVDVVAKKPDIIKIVHKFFHVENVSMEELLQEIFVAIIHKNHTRSAHDPRKSSFGHYVYLVSNNICINLVHMARRHSKESESLDATNSHDDGRTLLDTIENPKDGKQDELIKHMEVIESIMRKQEMWDHARYIRAARSGAEPDVIRQALTWGTRKITSKMIREIRVEIQKALTTNKFI